MHYKNLTTIGTSHVSKDSINEVKTTIEKIKPEIIAIELDKDRLVALLHKGKRGKIIKGVGFKGMIFAVIVSWIERKVGKIVKVEPGSEMRMAVQMAKKTNAKLALIDQHIAVTLRRFSKTLSWREKGNFVADLFMSVFSPNKSMKKLKLIKTDISKVPDKKTIKQIFKFFKQRYPNVYNVLVYERNVYMANQLRRLMQAFPEQKIIAVIGAGHEEEIIKLVKQDLNKPKKGK